MAKGQTKKIPPQKEAPKSNPSSAGMLGIYSKGNDAPGFKVEPEFVLVSSVVFIGLVVLLHIWAKIRKGGDAGESEIPTDEL